MTSDDLQPATFLYHDGRPHPSHAHLTVRDEEGGSSQFPIPGECLRVGGEMENM